MEALQGLTGVASLPGDTVAKNASPCLLARIAGQFPGSAPKGTGSTLSFSADDASEASSPPGAVATPSKPQEAATSPSSRSFHSASQKPSRDTGEEAAEEEKDWGERGWRASCCCCC